MAFNDFFILYFFQFYLLPFLNFVFTSVYEKRHSWNNWIIEQLIDKAIVWDFTTVNESPSLAMGLNDKVSRGHDEK